MDTEIVKEVARKLEALDALAKLFKNLWFEQIRKDVKDEKIHAYLTVFDDAFPHLNYVINFVRRSAEIMSDSNQAQDQQLKVEEEFQILHAFLIGKESEDVGSEISYGVDQLEDELSSQEKAALESVDQNDIEDLSIDETTDGVGDVLTSGEDEVGNENEEIEQHDSENTSDTIDQELAGVEISEDEILALLDDGSSDESESIEQESAGSVISEDEMLALVDDGSSDESESVEQESAGSVISEDEMLALVDDGSSDESESMLQESAGEDEKDASLNQDEIDALFG